MPKYLVSKASLTQHKYMEKAHMFYDIINQKGPFSRTNNSNWHLLLHPRWFHTQEQYIRIKFRTVKGCISLDRLFHERGYGKREPRETYRSVFRKISFSKKTIGILYIWKFIFITISIFSPLTLETLLVVHFKDCVNQKF